ncbi:MAG: response regulator transcription factor [Candidatus Obscuribacterales bacterium]|nr:response regulator transcription factor [Candidatus Obscuribacterales bacterium]
MSIMLLGETQEDLATAMKEYFSAANYTVQLENNGLQILQCLRHSHYAVIVLEIALPGIDAISIVRDYRAAGGCSPILLLAGKHSSEELRQGLDAGADGYLVKPFQLSDMAAQVRALLRRPAMQSERMLTLGGIAMDTGGGTVTRNDVLIHLHPMEFKLLQFLMTHPNQVFSAQALVTRVWQKDFGCLEGTVRTHIRTLRKKIDVVGTASIITTIRGLGYKTENR